MKITHKMFREFVRHCKKYIVKLSLSHWCVYYELTSLEAAYAQCEWNLPGKVATIFLNNEWTSFPLAEIAGKLKQTALHECLELLFAPLETLAGKREWNSEEWAATRHSVVRVLEKLLL